MEQVAEQTKINIRKLPKIIKNNSSYHFFDFVNQFRTEKAKNYLLDPKFNNYTVISIGLECGFSSKSAFYRAFTKFVNTTPTKFRQQNNG